MCVDMCADDMCVDICADNMGVGMCVDNMCVKIDLDTSASAESLIFESGDSAALMGQLDVYAL